MRDLIWRHYADGWPLLLGRCRDKRPMYGLSVWDATRDLATINRWASFWWPENMTIGNVLGRTGDRFYAFDVDPLEGGNDTLADLERQGLKLPATRLHGTPHDGRHPIYEGPPGLHGGKLGPGLTLRGFGSLVMLPGSVVDDKPYMILDDRPPVALPLWVPEWLFTLSSELALRNGGSVAELELEAELVDVDALPSHLARFLGDAPEFDRRSDQVWRFVANVLEYGYTAGQALTLAADYKPAIDKYGGRLDVEVRRVVAKLAPLHQHPGRPCDVAGCPHAPSWMGGAR